MEVTFQEAQAHLGLETQRQWSDLAIERRTIVLGRPISWATLVAHQLHHAQSLPLCQTAGYHNQVSTFADALA